MSSGRDLMRLKEWERTRKRLLRIEGSCVVGVRLYICELGVVFVPIVEGDESGLPITEAVDPRSNA